MIWLKGKVIRKINVESAL